MQLSAKNIPLSPCTTRYGQVDPNNAITGTEKAQPMYDRPVSTPMTRLARLTRATLSSSAALRVIDRIQLRLRLNIPVERDQQRQR